MCYSPARLILKQLSPSVSVPSDRYLPRRYSPPLLGIIVDYLALFFHGCIVCTIKFTLKQHSLNVN